MSRSSLAPPEDLKQALRQILEHPVRTLIPPWSWKAAVFNAVLRALTFFATNLRSGRWEATKAMLVEAVFAVFAGGPVGALSQQLRRAKPLWATAFLVWAGLPGIMIVAQFVLHRFVRTPHLGTGLITSFCLAAGASSFSWYAMRHGAMLGGNEETTIAHDLRMLPGLFLNFLLAAPAKSWDSVSRYKRARRNRTSTQAHRPVHLPGSRRRRTLPAAHKPYIHAWLHILLQKLHLEGWLTLKASQKRVADHGTIHGKYAGPMQDEKAIVLLEEVGDGHDGTGKVPRFTPILHQVILRYFQSRRGSTCALLPVQEISVLNARSMLAADQLGEDPCIFAKYRHFPGQPGSKLASEVMGSDGEMDEVPKDPHQYHAGIGRAC